MERVLTGMGLKLRDLGDSNQFRSLDLDLIVRDLRESGVPTGQLLFFESHRLHGCSRILLALDDVDERCEAMLLLRYGLCDDGLFSVVDALSAPTPRGQAILRRMVGWLLTRLDVAAGSVGGLVVHSRNEALRDAVVWASERIPAASIYPNAAQPTVSLDRARFARMLAQAAGIRENVHSQAATPFGDGRMATVLDVRAAKESDLDEQGRDMFRLRPRAIEQRKPSKGPRVAAVANTARSGAEVYWLRGA